MGTSEVHATMFVVSINLVEQKLELEINCCGFFFSNTVKLHKLLCTLIFFYELVLQVLVETETTNFFSSMIA